MKDLKRRRNCGLFDVSDEQDLATLGMAKHGFFVASLID
jgi:hypothetical protein